MSINWLTLLLFLSQKVQNHLNLKVWLFSIFTFKIAFRSKKKLTKKAVVMMINQTITKTKMKMVILSLDITAMMRPMKMVMPKIPTQLLIRQIC